uniref:Fatty acyl-CoA reductase n=1 Tax=Chenopodium quinoa TaxID=63459 RepID=A0A803MKK6_CHEQI
MDFESITEFLSNKTVLVTGATGFIAKILVEKILRVQPDVKKLYLLVRARDAQAADVRLQDEVLGKELFKVLKEKLGTHFEAFMSEKISVVAGDASYENLGLTAKQMKHMYESIDIVINVAATTKFDERYDVALGVNTLGAKNVVKFAKTCCNIQLLIHVSTAYVCGEKKGLISESSYAMGETLNGVKGLDIDAEKKLAEQTLSNLKAKDLPEKEIRLMMKYLGNQRAKHYGWPNTYVFTKAMGEMLVGQFRGNLPVVIMRPTIVCSTMKEPFPGWVEGCSRRLERRERKGTTAEATAAVKGDGGSLISDDWRTIDSVAVTYGKGILSIFPADRNTVLDLILLFVTRMGRSDLQRTLFNFDKKLKIAMKLVDLYKPYLFFKGIFVDTNTENLIKTARENGLDEDVFNFDPLCINWKDYFINIHIPSIVKYLF